MNLKNITLVLFAFVISSCNEVLDVQPKDSVSEVNFWKTEKDLNAAVNGVYNALIPVNNFDMFAMLDVETDIATARTVSPYNALAGGHWSSNNNIVLNKWVDNYRGIVRANDVLTHIDKMNVDEDLKKERKGEALFLRAWFYFNLVYFYGDVPLILDVPTLDEALVKKTSKDLVIDQMHKDLEQAVKLLKQHPDDIGRVTKGAAFTLQAKIYMQDRKYKNAIPPLDSVMNLGYRLYDNYRDIFMVRGENNPEVIFDIEHVSNTGKELGNRFNTLYGNQSLKAIGWSWFLPTKQLVDLYETKPDGRPDPNPLFDKKDPRMDMTIMRPGATFVNGNGVVSEYPKDVRNYAHEETGMSCRKLIIEGNSADASFSGSWDSPNNWIFFRYADVLLLYAEARIEINDIDQSVYDAINEVRTRPSVEMPTIDPPKTQGELREIIRRERGVELALEGWRYFDLKRWGLLKQINDGFKVVNINDGSVIETRTFDDRNLLWPIPLSEMDKNPNLKPQNPGW